MTIFVRFFFLLIHIIKNYGEECQQDSQTKQCRENSICCGNRCIGCDNEICDSDCESMIERDNIMNNKRFQYRPREALSEWKQRQQQRLKSLKQQNDLQEHDDEQKFNLFPYFRFAIPRLPNEV